ncbi:MAG: hypothetical protein ABIJ00_11325 [Candidatus Eisenbacteria bacterium]
MMTRICVLILLVLHVSLPIGAAAGLPADIRPSVTAWEPDEDLLSPRLPFLGPDGPEADQDKDGEAPRTSKFVGYSLLVSGISLCVWGIASWEVEEYQCCPARNTGNVVKIVGGVMLLNAGLIYLLSADD